jgi:hypothetical protein
MSGAALLAQKALLVPFPLTGMMLQLPEAIAPLKSKMFLPLPLAPSSPVLPDLEKLFLSAERSCLTRQTLLPACCNRLGQQSWLALPQKSWGLQTLLKGQLRKPL